MNPKLIFSAAALLLTSICHAALPGTLGVDTPYGDGMVLQRHRPITVTGTGVPMQPVTGSLGTANAGTTADSSGRWVLTFPQREAATGLTLTLVQGTDTVRIGDIAVGEVWIASGQSNMEFTLNQSVGGKIAAADANDPLLRFYTMRPRFVTNSREWDAEAQSQTDSLKYYKTDGWLPVTGDNAPGLSAVAYYFARELRDSLQIPVGVIANAVGGSPTESWIPLNLLEQKCPEALRDWPDNEVVQPWVGQRAHQNVPGASDGHRHPYQPAYLYEAGIRPLGHFPAQGVIWYQGESNAHSPQWHEVLFPIMVEAWRENTANPGLVFNIVQLSSINRELWPEFRDSQRRMAGEMPGVLMAVSSDHGDSLDVHPRNKKPIGHRLALQALANVYDLKLNADGPAPLCAEACAGGDSVRLRMTPAVALTTRDGMAPRTFELCGPDNVWHRATATILPDASLLLHADGVTAPQSVRYGWQPYTRANLINTDSLPASTFMINVLPHTSPESGITAGVSAAYAGLLADMVISAGGANFPNDPLGATSPKKLYAGIYGASASSLTDGAVPDWKCLGQLPSPSAYGATAQLPDALVLIGGTDANGSLTRVLKLSVGTDGNLSVVPLPDLPCTMDNMNACALDGVIYVAGGNCDGKPSNTLLALDMADTAKGWQRLPDFPGNPRTQPAVAAAQGAVYLFSGFAGGADPTLDRDILRYDIAGRSWSRIEPALLTEDKDINFGGGTAATLPDGRILVAGGVNPDIFLNALRATPEGYILHPVEWYRFNPAITVFDPADSTLTVVERNPSAARAGASAVTLPDGSVLLLGGEIKPRIRTPHSFRIKP